MRRVALITVALMAANAFAFNPAIGGTNVFWLLVSAPVLALATLAAFMLHREGRLLPLLRPKSGDLTLGAVVGGLLLLASWAGRSLLAGWETSRQAWLMNVYLQVGDPDVLQNSLALTTLLFAVIVGEEVIFRGLIQEQATAALGERRGWLVAALAYAAMLLPTVVTLRAPGVGLNPLLLLAALLCGLTWSFVRRLTGRLVPTIVAHALFTYFSVVQFRLPGM